MALLFVLVRASIPPRDYLRFAVDPWAGRYLFNWLSYEWETLSARLARAVLGVDGGAGESRPSAEALVQRYFALAEESQRLEDELNRFGQDSHPDSPSVNARLEQALEVRRRELSELEDDVEAILRQQVASLLREQGITWRTPLWGEVVFPPVDFEFQTSPLLLVISRRERIATLEQLSLYPHLDLAHIEEIEARTDALNVSSLVVPTGGMGSYPPIVAESGSLTFAVGAAIHEWVHNYLYFFPLGQRYGDSPELTTMNETVASLVEEELSLEVLRRYYPQLYPQRLAEVERARQPPTERPVDPFAREMRRIRLHVDELLAQGRVEEAERFMELERRRLNAQGYSIRKLNQAYFAFYGSYATDPAAVSPIGQQLRELRARGPSLADFLNTVAQMRIYEELLAALHK
ncbi:MAG: hypothetical protein HYZ68_07005 [Chloroflexi bacterium]|nr:hypothetical protein [Chloroflexota bacterium]